MPARRSRASEGGHAPRRAAGAEPSRAGRGRRSAVQPLYPYRRYHSLYPLPYRIEYPGPNAKRDCADRYVTRNRGRAAP